jgi:C1A family cysteine protease
VAYQIKRLGWLPDLPDHRDFTYAAPTTVLKALPPHVDLRKECPKTVYDQGRLGSCTANAIAAAIEFDQIKQGQPESTPSRLFIYYNERAMEHSVQVDSGAQIRDGVKSVAKIGVCPETLWPYDDTPPPDEDSPCPSCKFAQKPPGNCFTEAGKHQILVYRRLHQDATAMKGCLASGYPFVLGFTCYSNLPFDSTTGEIPMPASQDHVIGGHAVLAVGYDDGAQKFIIRNSWGRKWGKQGYGFLPYAYLLNPGLASDFWTIRTVE